MSLIKTFLFVTCVSVLFACGSTVTSENKTDLPLVHPTKVNTTQSPTIVSTRTLAPSETSSPTETITPLPSKTSTLAVHIEPTSSFDLCPEADSSVEFNVESAWSTTVQGNRNEHFTNYVLGFLNSGGSMEAMMPAFEEHYGKQIDPFFQILDVTGDNSAELIFPYGIWIDVFGCKNGKYELIFVDTYDRNLGGVSIVDVTDINQNELADMIVYFNGCMGQRCPIIRVYEWAGNEFNNLIADSLTDNGCSNLTVAPLEVEVRDVDNNGTKEIILKNSGSPQLDSDFPYRQETRTCVWNGQNIVVQKNEFDAPYYRFQAVQDGDRAMLSGVYEQALSFYQQAINDKKLQWFTPERKWHDFWMRHAEIYSSEPTPTVSPTMLEDPDEYLNLAAYSYYRIMLLYILEDKMALADETLDTLQNEFPPGTPGNYFTQMALIFWQEYQLSQSMIDSCKKVIEYTQEYSLPTEYLGDWDHGAHSLEYTPESICPFK